MKILNDHIPNYKKEKLKQNILEINNKNPIDLNLIYENHFLKDDNNIKILNIKQKNNYQNLFIHRKLYDTNIEKKKNKKYSSTYNHDHEKSNEKDKLSNYDMKLNYYYTNTNLIEKKNDSNNAFLIDNLDKLKEMNSDLNNILFNMQKSIQPNNKQNNLNNYLKESNQIYNYKTKTNTKENNSKSKSKSQKTINTIHFIEEIGNKNINEINSVKKYREINEDINSYISNDIEEKNINANINNKGNNYINNNNKYINNKNMNKIFIIDKNNKNEINIKGIKTDNIDLTKINLNKLKKEQQNKINLIYNNNNDKNRKKAFFNINDLINDLYKYKIKYEEIKNILDNKKEDKAKEFNHNLLNIKNENKSLSEQKNFLINELTKSIYNNEKLEQKYKEELDRIDAYTNKVKYDLKAKKDTKQ